MSFLETPNSDPWQRSRANLSRCHAYEGIGTLGIAVANLIAPNLSFNVSDYICTRMSEYNLLLNHVSLSNDACDLYRLSCASILDGFLIYPAFMYRSGCVENICVGTRIVSYEYHVSSCVIAVMCIASNVVSS